MLPQQPSNQILQQQSLSSMHGKIIYLVKHSGTRIFCSQSLERFNLYKRFVENTILELGEDWRIESGLLAQEIISEKSLTNDQFCIFNEFMAGFMRSRLGQQNHQPQLHNKKIVTQQQGQQQFLKYFDKSLSKNGFATDNQTQPQTNDYSNNLTFKTLSLGFYITAGDIWSKTFKKYHRQSMAEKLNNINIAEKTTLNYFATLDTTNGHWIIHQENQVKVVLAPLQHKIDHQTHNSLQNLSQAIQLGSVVVNISQTVIKYHSENQQLTVRVFTLCTQFYLTMFLIWLIFSIKKSFNSSSFSSVCYVRYCDIIIGSKIFPNNSNLFSSFHTIYRQFKLLCDNQWKNLMKDYMMALNDDKEVLKTLVKKIGEKIEQRFLNQINGKKVKLQH